MADQSSGINLALQLDNMRKKNDPVKGVKEKEQQKEKPTEGNLTFRNEENEEVKNEESPAEPKIDPKIVSQAINFGISSSSSSQISSSAGFGKRENVPLVPSS